VRRCGLIAVDYFTEILGWPVADRDAAIAEVVANGAAQLVVTSVAVWIEGADASCRASAPGARDASSPPSSA